MLEGLVTWVLNNYLGKYVENLNTDQLSIALLSGEVELENLPIRKDALRLLGLPLQVRAGYIGRVRLQIPVRQFRSAPWVILIEQLNVVAGPVNIDEWDDELEKNANLERKLNKLDAHESKWRAQRDTNSSSGRQRSTSSTGYYASSYTSWLSYGANFVSGIVDNLQFKIRDIHIRYEDSISIPGQIFACGITLTSLTTNGATSDNSTSSINVNYNGNATSNGTSASGAAAYSGNTTKTMELQSLAIYWDAIEEIDMLGTKSLGDLALSLDAIKTHQYILKPVRGKAQLGRETQNNPTNREFQTCNGRPFRPRLVCDLQLHKVPLALVDWQYEQIIQCAQGLENVAKVRKNRLSRPSTPIKENVKAWWLYALKCNGHDFYRPTWGECLAMARDNINYVELYTKLLIAPSCTLNSEQKQLKERMETMLSLDKIKALREISMNRVPEKPEDSNSINDSTGYGVLFQWFPQYWGWYGSSVSSKTSQLTNDSSALLCATSSNNVLDTEFLNALANVREDRQNCHVVAQFDFILEEGTFSICMGESFNKSVPMLELHFESVRVSVEARSRNGSYQAKLALGSVSVLDKITKNSIFPVLVCPQGNECAPLPRSRQSAQRTHSISVTQQPYMGVDRNNEPLFSLCFERKPLGHNSDYSLKIKSQALDIVYNKSAVQWLVDFICKPHQMAVTRRKINDMKMRTKQELIKNWEQLLEGDLSERKFWLLELDISAPQIIFVENFFDCDTCVAVLDFGRLILSNKQSEETEKNLNESGHYSRDSEDEEMFMTPCSTPPGSEASSSDSPIVFSCVDVLKTQPDNLILNQNNLHDRIYDKYNVEFLDLQVLVGRAADNWNFAHTKGTSPLHVLDRFNISIQIERRLVHTVDPQYPSLILSGTLPRLVMHVSEQKIFSLKKLLDILEIEKTGSPIKSPSNADPLIFQDAMPTADVAKESSSKIITLQFSIEQLAIEVQSRGKSVAELQVTGVKLGFTKCSTETSTTLLVHGLLLVDALQTFGPDFELLVASHKHVGMDSVSGSLWDSDPCSPTSPASPEPMVVAKRSTSPHQLSQALNSLRQDHISPVKETIPKKTDTEALIVIEVLYVNASETEEAVQIASIQFNNLDIIANQETIVELIGFANRVLPKFQSNGSMSSFKAAETKDNLVNNTRAEITFDFHRLNVLVLRALLRDGCYIGRKVATATMSEARIHATVGAGVTIEGSLGGLQVLDLTPSGIIHQRVLSVGKDPLTDPEVLPQVDLLQMLTTEIYNKHQQTSESECKEALSFRIEQNTVGNSKETDVQLKLRMGSVWYTYSPHLLVEIKMCVTEFQTYLSALAHSIRARATDMAFNLVQARMDSLSYEIYPSIGQKKVIESTGCNITINLDVVLETPVLVLPRGSTSPHVFVAHLGRISLTNSQSSTNEMVPRKINNAAFDTYIIEIRDMNLYSLDTSDRRNILYHGTILKAEELYCSKGGLPILHDTTIKLEIARELPDFYNSMELIEEKNIRDCVHVNGCVVTPLRVSLSREQYEQFLDTVDNLISSPKDFRSVRSEDQVDSKTFTGLIAKHKNILDAKVKFEMPCLTLELRGDYGTGQQGLVEISLREFILNYEKCNEFETNILVSLQSLIMEDLLKEPDSKYRYMMVSSASKQIWQPSWFVSHSCPDFIRTCCGYPDVNSRGSLPNHLESRRTYRKPSLQIDPYPVTPPSSPKYRESDKLVKVSALLVDEQAPEFTTKYRSLHKCVSVDFSGLDTVVAVQSWLVVLDFFGMSESKHHQEEHFQEESSTTSVTNSEVEIFIRSLNMIMIRRDNDLAKVSISNVSFAITKDCSVKLITGILGSLIVMDLTPQGNAYREKFTTCGDEALNFTYFTNLKNQKANDKNLDGLLRNESNLKVEMASVKYVHTKRFVTELQYYFKHLSLLQNIMDRVRQRTKNKHKTTSNEDFSQAEEVLSRLLLDIRISRPVIILPAGGASNSYVVADAEALTIHNTFKMAVANAESGESGVPVDCITIQLVDADLYEGSQETSILDSYFGSRFKQRPSLLAEKRTVDVIVERRLNMSQIFSVVPDLTIQCTLSKLDASLNVDQYALVRGILKYNLGENLDDLVPPESSIMDDNEIKNWEKSENPQQSIRTVSCLRILLHDVTIDLNMKHTEPLARVNFIKSRLTIDSYSDETQDIDLVSQEILVTDSRYKEEPVNKRGNVFSNILQPIRYQHDSNQVQLELHSRIRENNSKFTILLNNMRLMAIWDWLEIAKDYLGHCHREMDHAIASCSISHNRLNCENSFEASTTKSNDAKYQQESQPKSISQSSKEDNKAIFELKFNITDSELVVVENASQWDTNAVILKCTSVVSYRPVSQKPLSLNLNRLEVFSCVLGAEEESALSIIDPVTVQIDLGKDCLLEVQLHTLCIRLSYHDVLMFRRIFASLPQQFKLNSETVKNKSSTPVNAKSQIAKLAALGFARSECAKALEQCDYLLDDAALLLTARSSCFRNKRLWSNNESDPDSECDKKFNISTLEIKSDCVSLCIIDDCKDSDVPLLEFSLTDLFFRHELKNERHFPLADEIVCGMPKPILPPLPVEDIATNEALVVKENRILGHFGTQLRANLSGDYYNRALSGWEPFIESWKCDVGMQLNEASKVTGLANDELLLRVFSSQMLNMNITSTLIDLYNMVHKNLMQDIYSRANDSGQHLSASSGFKRRYPFVPFALKNETGNNLWFYTLVTSPDSHLTKAMPPSADPGWHLVRPGETVPLSFVQTSTSISGVSVSSKQRGGTRHNEPTLHQTFARVQGWAPVGPVSVDKVGVYFRHAHAEYETMNLEMPRARIVFSVTLEGSAQKLVTVRSALRILNNIDCSIQLCMEYYNGQFGILNWPPNKEALVQPGSVYSVPLTHAHSHIRFRPVIHNQDSSFKKSEIENFRQERKTVSTNFRNKLSNFEFCKQPLMWWRIQRSGEVIQELRTCYDKDKVYRLVACIRRDNYPNTTSITTTSAGNMATAIVQPAHTITIAPVVLLCNRLPCDIIYRLTTPSTGIGIGSSNNGTSNGRLRPEARLPLTEIDLEKSTEIQIALDGFSSPGNIHLQAGSLCGIGAGTIGSNYSLAMLQQTAVATQRIRLLDHDNRPLHLEASVTCAKNGGLQVSVWCPFWIVNKAGLPVVVAQEGAGREAAGQGVEHEAGRMAAPLLFSLADQDAAPALVLRRGGRGYQDGGVPQWCQPLHLQPGVQVRRLITTQCEGRPDAVALVGVEVCRRLAVSGDPSDGTMLVIITPRHRVRNRSSSRIELSQKCFATTVSDPGASATYQHAPPGSEQAFHWPRPDRDQLLCLRLPDVQDCLWSAGLRVDRTHSLHVNIRNSSGSMHFVRVEVLLQGATYFIVIGDAQELPPPIRIDNYSQVPITFYQSGFAEQWRSVARPGTAVAYAPDEPPAGGGSSSPSSGGGALICLVSPGGQRAIYDVNELGPAGGLAYENFIYIAFTGTFDGEEHPSLNFESGSITGLPFTSNCVPDVTRQQLVLTDSGGRLVLARKQAGDRSQLWRMTSSGQLQHEGSSPPRDLYGGLVDSRGSARRGYSDKILVLDIEGPAPRPARYERLALRRPDPRRRSTQTWRFSSDGRLVCAHNGVCVQAKDGLFGLRPGGEAVLGLLGQQNTGYQATEVPLEQAVGRQRMRPGSGFLSVTIVTDGPTRVLQIHDVKIPASFPLPCDWRSSTAQVMSSNESDDKSDRNPDITLSVRLDGGLGVSLVSRPCSISTHISSKDCDDQAELLYASLHDISLDACFSKTVRRMDLKIGNIQIDNQLLDAPCPVLLHSRTAADRKTVMPAIHACCEVLPSPNLNAVIFKHFIIQLRPLSVFLEERLLLRLALFVGLRPPSTDSVTSRRSSLQNDHQDMAPALATSTSNAKRYYFGILQIVPGQIRLSMMTSSKLPPQLQAVKRHLGLTLIKFEDAAIELEAFSRRHPFETSESLVQSIIKHYKDELKWQAANILGSVDFLGNPLGFVNDVSEGVSGLFSEGNIAALVKNVTHGLSNSAAKVTESLSDGIGRVILDERHEEARRRIREAVAPSGHLAAGLKGLGFGLLGGVTSIVKQTYEGAAAEGVQGLFSGLGKGLVGTVTKPIVGVLDLASETATAVRDSSRSSNKALPERTRLPRCVSSGPGGLLPSYNERHALGQQYLFALNGRNFAEMFIGYESIRRGLQEDLQVLVSTDRVRVFTGTPLERANIVIEVHLRDLVNCKYVRSTESDRKLHYIELKVTVNTNHSLHGDIAVKRPRVRCDSELIALSVSRQINYAKSIYAERLQTLITSDIE